MTRTITTHYRIRQHRDGCFYPQVRHRFFWYYLSANGQGSEFGTSYSTQVWSRCSHNTIESSMMTIRIHHNSLKEAYERNKKAKFVTVKTIELTMEA